MASLLSPMQSQVGFGQVTLEQVVERICAFRQLTSLDHSLLKSALCSLSSITPEQHTLLNQVFDGLQRGWIWVGD
jgi:hypothetical protein